MKSRLLSPFGIKDIVLKNRIAVSPMCQYSAVDGYANDWHLVHLGSRAVGGAALIIQEATAVSPEGRITPADLGLYRDEHIEKLGQITQFIKDQGCVAAVQLAHAGRKAGCATPWKGGRQLKLEEGGWITSSSSDIPFFPEDRPPQAMNIDELHQVANDFENAASRALRAGYQIIEVHAAHGYLLHQFLSPLSNNRADQYGGSFENRIRLLQEIVAAVRNVWPKNMPLFVRISATDWAEGGWNPDEAVKLACLLKANGVDLVDCSSGGLIPDARVPLSPGYQVAFAEKFRKEAKIATSAVGLITSAEQAEKILGSDSADLVMFGRESLREPYLALNAAHELNEEIEWPLQYVRAKK